MPKNSLKIKLQKNPSVSQQVGGVVTLKKSCSFTVMVEGYTETGTVAGKQKPTFLVEDKKPAVVSNFSDIRWIWSVAKNKLEFSKSDYNEDFKTGIARHNFNFPEFLEGGGFCYLEAFHNNIADLTIANSPNVGFLIQALGEPKIIGVQWRRYQQDNRGALIKEDEKIPIGETVQLHIFTKGLYGQEIDIQLFDYDEAMGADNLNKDEVLPPFERKNKKSVDIKDEEEYPAMPARVSFTREVSYFEVKDGDPSFEGIPIGQLNSEKKTEPDKSYVQKCVMDVYIDPFWVYYPYANEEEMKIYPKIKHQTSDVWVESSKYINIHKKENKIVESKLSSTGNKPVLVGEIETKEALYQPCRYTKVTGKYGSTDEVIIFEQNPQKETPSQLIYQLLADDQPKMLMVNLPDLDTNDCNFHKKPKDHADHAIKLIQPERFTNKNVQKSLFTFDASYPKPTTNEELIKMAWLPNIKPILYNAELSTCRFQHPLEVDIYPNIEFTFTAHLGVEEDEYLFVTQSKNYKKRDYKGKKKDGTKAAKKDNNKRVKENFKETVDNQVKKDNFREKYKVSIGTEYKFGEGEPVAIEFALLKDLEEIIENIMYVYDTVDSYIFGDQMKQIEEGESFDENGNKVEQDAKKKKANKKEYEKKKEKRQNKKNNSMPKAAGFPVRFTVSPPKFTGGVTWGYKPSKDDPSKLGVNYQFKFGALPLIGLEGRLDLLFCAQFIPYVGQIVKALDKAVAAINKVGDALEWLKLGSMEAEYYFDLVCTTQLDIDVVRGSTYHTIDGFTGGHVQVESPLAISLEAGGSIKMELINIKGEAAITASATAKFKVYYLSDRKEFLTFEFEGVEGIVKAKFNFSEDKDNEEPEEPEKEPDPVPILSGFKIDIPLFKKTIVENPHKDEN